MNAIDFFFKLYFQAQKVQRSSDVQQAQRESTSLRVRWLVSRNRFTNHFRRM